VVIFTLRPLYPDRLSGPQNQFGWYGDLKHCWPYRDSSVSQPTASRYTDCYGISQGSIRALSWKDWGISKNTSVMTESGMECLQNTHRVLPQFHEHLINEVIFKLGFESRTLANISRTYYECAILRQPFVTSLWSQFWTSLSNTAHHFPMVYQKWVPESKIIILIIGLCILLSVYQSIYIETSVRNKCRCSFYCALLTLHVSAPISGHLQVVL
jgi:hypothetical protein